MSSFRSPHNSTLWAHKKLEMLQTLLKYRNDEIFFAEDFHNSACACVCVGAMPIQKEIVDTSQSSSVDETMSPAHT